MRNVFSLHVETRVSLAIITIVVIIFLVTVFKSLDNFNKFIDRINQYEEIRIETNP
jgi:uncharacterized protein YoxC